LVKLPLLIIFEFLKNIKITTDPLKKNGGYGWFEGLGRKNSKQSSRDTIFNFA